MTPFPHFFYINLNILSKRKPGFASAATYWGKKTQKHRKESKIKMYYSTHGSENSLKKLSEKKKRESYTKNPLITN